MDLLNPLAEAYAERMSSPLDPILEAVYNDTNASHAHAHMMSSRLQAKFLEIFSILVQPLRILEVGTFTGLSGICLAKGLASGGKLHTIEVREEDAATARANFVASNLSDRIILHVGNALNIIPELAETWDLVFIDADKTGYLEYYKLILPRVRAGGVILADNVFFHGQVLTEPLSGKNAKAIHEFNEFVSNDEQVEKVLIPIRDGLMLIRKK
jgi:predicted O-methyltransferase YrrM